MLPNVFTRNVSLVASMVVALAAALLLTSSAATAGNNQAVERKEIAALDKATFLKNLSAAEAMLVGFLERGQDNSERLLYELETFAGSAQGRHPDLNVYKVDHQEEPYLTARMLLTRQVQKTKCTGGTTIANDALQNNSIPELHLLVRDSSGKWVSHSLDAEISAADLASYMDSQGWMLASNNIQGQNFCTPFNLCGRILGDLAEKSIAFERALPIPKWLAMILIPALITFAGRFIIESMYSTEERLRAAVGAPDNTAAATEADAGSVAQEEPKKTK